MPAPENRAETGAAPLVPLLPSCSQALEAPTANGRFLPGQTGNPGGRPKGLAALVRSQTMDGAELVAFYLAIMRGTKRIDKRAPPLALRMDAAAWLADRAFGKPPQQLEHGGAEGGPLRIIIEYGEGAEDDAGSGYPAS